MVAPHPNPPRKNGERGRALREAEGTERPRHTPFAPRAGRRWRQPDEGQPLARTNNRQPSARTKH
ncbi:hypothetical protein E0H35_33435 [Rhizobium leguminosarum bv. viciae]|nr:hypothetical protein [Rhizobium leguminosarum bv. viciae]NKL53218.1 hypothetical protein [Rhizobium leguminosarum bv. viciae]TBF97363.1 hypothetical protein ELG85_00700 [Rhizobium leguminosarum]TBG82758.1 hypothetical protein ELG69_00705 [Rhizobium leguminosarum]TBY88827.1 hypothetical protein E0H35_33435 [Rhizobium leguminosarum bv. viciae]